MTHNSDTGPAYRWIIVLVAAAMLAIAMGQLVNGLSVFFIPLEREFGWPRGSIALINSAGLVGLAVGSIAMGASQTKQKSGMSAFLVPWLSVFPCWQRRGPLSSGNSIYCSFLAGAFGGGSLFAPLIALVGNWFRTGAGLAIGIASAGQAVGRGGVPFGTAYLIDTLGWRGAFINSGVISLVTLVPLALLTKEPDGRSDINGSNAMDESVPLPTNIVVVWLSAAVLFCCSCMSVPLMHLVPLCQGKGIAAPEAGSVLFVVLIAAILGRVAFGKLADTIGAIPTYMTASLWQTMLVFVFTQIDSLDVSMLRPYLWLRLRGCDDWIADYHTRVDAGLAPRRRDGHNSGVRLAGAWPRRLSGWALLRPDGGIHRWLCKCRAGGPSQPPYSGGHS